MKRNISNVQLTPVNPSEDEELYQGHGSHNDAIMDVEELLKGYLRKIIQDSKVHKTAKLDIMWDDKLVESSTVTSLQYGEKDLNLLALIASNIEKDKNVFVSMFPHMTGSPHKVVIDKVLEWDNRMEATIKFSIGDYSFACFAEDYFYNKDKYVVGNELYLNLASLGLKVQEGMKGFDFEGQQVVDFLAKTGETPDYDEQGNVEPLHFSMEGMIAYFATDKKAPDEAEFQSPVTDIYNFRFLDIPFVKCNIVIDNEDAHTVIPLYFRKEFLPNLEQYNPIAGWLWLTGEIAEDVMWQRDETLTLGERLRAFEEAMLCHNFKAFQNLDYITNLLPHIKVRDGYELDGFRQGDDHDSAYCLYVCKQHSTTKWIPYPNVVEKPSFCERIGRKKKKKPTPMPYDDSMYLSGLYSYDDTEKIPPFLPYFEVPFTELGIMEAWLLTIAPNFMPKVWHACYSDVDYIADRQKFEKLFSDTDNRDTNFITAANKVKTIPFDELLPQIKIDGNRASLIYSYWSEWRGLVRETVVVTPKGKSVEFSPPSVERLVPYDCGLLL